MKDGRGHYDYEDEESDEEESDDETNQKSNKEELSEKDLRKMEKQKALIERRKKEKEQSERFMNEMKAGTSTSTQRDESAHVTFGEQVGELLEVENGKKSNESILRRNQRGEAEPVSYTHLDVYKRQFLYPRVEILVYPTYLTLLLYQ